MDRETLDSLDKNTLIRLILSQAEAIERLTRDVAELRADNSKLHADNVRLQADNAELRAKLNLPPKTPENSSTPPSQGNKVSGDESETSEGKRRKPHAGAHRPLHPNPRAVQFSIQSWDFEDVVDVEGGAPSRVFDVGVPSGAEQIVGEGA